MAETIIQTYAEIPKSPAETAELLSALQKKLSWMLTHLDSRNVQSINTNLTTVQSEDGATTLDGAQLIMQDAKGNVRAEMGKDRSGNFIFRLYDEYGNTAVSLDDDGRAIFTGKIRSAEIEGTNIRIAPNEFRDYIAIENDGTEDSLSLYYGGTRIGGIRMLDAGGMEIFGSKISIGSSKGSVSIAPGATGTFTADGKTVTVESGVITSIQ